MAEKRNKETEPDPAPDPDEAARADAGDPEDDDAHTVESAKYDDVDDMSAAAPDEADIATELPVSEKNGGAQAARPGGVPGPAQPTTVAAASSRRSVVMALLGGLVVGAGGGFGGGYYWATRRRRRPSGPRPELGRANVPIEPWNPRKGANPAKVTIVEFSDFQ